MRTTVLPFLIALLIIGGCSDGSGDETTNSFEVIPGVPDRPAIEVVEEMLAAIEVADDSAVFRYHHPRAVVFTFEGDSFSLADSSDGPVEDFDGDGAATSADVVQWNFAMRGSWGEQSTWDCREIDRSNVECTIASTNDLVGTGSGFEWVEVQSFRVEGGLIVEVRSMTDPEDNGLADATMVRELFAYERWVNQQHPGTWPELFDEPCCNLEFKELPNTIPLHEQLVSEFIATR